VVEVVVDTKGRVTSAKALEGPEALQATAVDYGKGWRFEPAKLDGKPVRARFKLTMPFRLP
jgi:TonB family protein